LRGIKPTLKPPSVWNQFKRSELDEYGDIPEATPRIIVVEPKPEPFEAPPYDALQASEMDKRLHGYGGPSNEFRRAVRAAYVTRELPEDQFPKACGCGEDAFCERLESVLKFVGRFA